MLIGGGTSATQLHEEEKRLEQKKPGVAGECFNSDRHTSPVTVAW